MFDDPDALFLPGDDEDGMLEIVPFSVDPDALQHHSPTAPRPEEWKRIQKHKHVSVHVDFAREVCAEQAQREFDFLKENVAALVGNEDASEFVGLGDIAGLFFGRESKIFRCFADNLPQIRNDHRLFCRCIGAYLLSCVYGFPLEVLIEDLKPEKYPLPTKEEYNFFWGLLSGADAFVNESTNRSEKAFWRRLEENLNDILRKIAVVDFPGEMRVTVDDDKCHYAKSAASQKHEPKRTQHVRANRKGTVADTAAYTASGIPIGLSTHGQGDSTLISTKRLLQSALSASVTLADTDNSSSSALDKVFFFLDRGYSMHELFLMIIKNGGTLEVATVMRNAAFPFTYDQKLKESDRRIDFPTDGPKKFAEVAHVDSKSKVVTNSFVYINGT